MIQVPVKHLMQDMDTVTNKLTEFLEQYEHNAKIQFNEIPDLQISFYQEVCRLTGNLAAIINLLHKEMENEKDYPDSIFDSLLS